MKYFSLILLLLITHLASGQKVKDLPLPEGYSRLISSPGSYSSYLQNLPLSSDPVLHLYNGKPAYNQTGHYRIIDLDVGTRDLQQCADAAIRLRAEYLFHQGRKDEISFKFTSGDEASFIKYAKGFRPKIQGSNVSWSKVATEDASYTSFRKYLNLVFSYAGSYSLERDMTSVAKEDIKIGDVIIQGGFPGHAVVVVDLAQNAGGDQIVLLGQSYMPAQEFHIIKNPNSSLTPWYKVENLESVVTPSWRFKNAKLKRF